jgi:tryptophan synthase beta chain
MFDAFLDEPSVELVGVEAGGLGIKGTKHATRLSPSKHARPGILHGSYSYVLQDDHGQIADTHSVSAGLDYSGVGPQHSFLHETGRVRYTYATDKQAVAAFTLLCECEGIIPALESAHAVAWAAAEAPRRAKDNIMVINLSGRGDKDIFSVADYLGKTI